MNEHAPPSLREFFQAVRDRPQDFVEPCDPIYLWAFFNGCAEANAALRAPIRSLLDDLPGPSAADPWSRAYLLYAPGEAVRILLNRLCQTTIENDFEPGLSAWT